MKGVISTFRTHPAILAWYLNDELPLTWHDKLVRNYRWLRDLDPDHPGYIVLYQVDELDGYADTTDVFGVDPYPIPSRPVTMVSDWTDAAVKTGRPVWVVPQIFDWSVYNTTNKPSPPTFEEMRCMTYLALTHGANGLIYYSYFDLKRAPNFEKRWGEVKRLVGEVRQLVPWMLAPRPSPLQKENGLHLRSWQRGKEILIVAINPERKPIEAKVRLPQGVRKVEVLFENRAVIPEDGSIAETFEPLAVHVYRVGP